MRYAGFSYITPPRAEVKIPRSLLPSYQEKGWWAQVKKNGTNWGQVLGIIRIALDQHSLNAHVFQRFNQIFYADGKPRRSLTPSFEVQPSGS